MDAKRLILFPYAPEYLRAMAEGLKSSRSILQTASEEFLARLQTAIDPEPWTCGFAVVERETSSVVGIASFKAPPTVEGIVEISYGISAAFRNRGYASEAVQWLLKLATDSGRVSMVIAHTVPSNEASKRVLEKCGFTRVGEALDPVDGLVLRWERSTEE
jgi:ribosomal-protein-alanine N-acetyltransferase